MKGLVFTGDMRTEVREFPIPEPKADEVRIKTMASAICGSDMMFYKAPSDLLKSGAFGATGAGAAAISIGTISGHEASGYVDAVGVAVTNVKVGDRVTFHHHQGCGHCKHCLDGEPMLCQDRRPLGVGIHGSNAEYCVIKAACVLPLHEELSFATGAFLGCQAATAYSSLMKAEVSGNDLLVVYGVGALGQQTALMAKKMGARVVGIDISDYRLNLLKEKGIIDVGINSLHEDCKAILMDLTHGIGVKKGIVACGADQMRRLSADVASVKGVIVITGASEGNMDPTADASWSFDGRAVLRKELVIRGSYVCPLGLFEDLQNFLVDMNVDLDQLVTHHYTIEQGDEAFALFAKGQTGKVVFDFE